MPKAVEQVMSTVGQFFDMGEKGNKDAIDLLKQDHRKVEGLFAEFEKAGSNKQSILDQIIKELSIHATVEENLVYPLLEDDKKMGEKTDEAFEEHHVVKMMLAELADTPAAKASAKVKVLKEMVNHHVKEEERELLPQLKKSGADLQRLAEDILRRKQQIMSGVQRGGGIGQNKDIKAQKTSSSVRKPAGKKTSAPRKSTAKKTTKPPAKTAAQAKRNTRMKTNRKKSA